MIQNIKLEGLLTYDGPAEDLVVDLNPVMDRLEAIGLSGGVQIAVNHHGIVCHWTLKAAQFGDDGYHDG